MSLSSTHVIFICFAFVCILIGMQYTIYSGQGPTNNTEELIGQYEMANSELNQELLAEIKILKDSMEEINHKINTNQAVLNNHTLNEFLENPVDVIVDTPAYRNMASYAEQKADELVSLKKTLGLFEKKKCKAQDKIYFLKTSKTGSTSVANILTRFGLRRNGTTFLMGEASNGGFFFANSYMPFNAETCYLGSNLPKRPIFDISYVHMRYNKTAVDLLMHPDHKKITILREPSSNFASSWKYYSAFYEELRASLDFYKSGVGRYIKGSKEADFVAEMEDFLKSPNDFMSKFHFAHGAHFFLYNPQLVFFGYPSYLLKYTTAYNVKLLVDSWLGEIDRDFDHVLILERIDTSLALMMIKFCWDIDDIIHLKLNSMKKSTKTLSDGSIASLKQFNWADYKLYDYFNNRLDREIKEIGVEKVSHYEKLIQARMDQYIDECLEKEQNNGVAWITSIKLLPEKRKNQTCYLLTKDNSNLIEFEHLLRWKKEFPDYFIKEAVAEGSPPKDKVPKFCKGPNNWREWFEKQEPFVRSLFDWPTSEYDIRPDWPDYIKEFSKPLTDDEKKLGSSFRRIWN